MSPPKEKSHIVWLFLFLVDITIEQVQIFEANMLALANGVLYHRRPYGIIQMGGDFLFNFIALWIRLITLIVLAVVVTAIVLFFGRNRFKKWEKIVTVCMAVALVLLGGGSTLKSLMVPEIKTIVGIYGSELRVKGLSLLEKEYCFDSENEKFYLNLDVISKNIMFDSEFVKGEKYIISYETESNLIVAISQKD